MEDTNYNKCFACGKDNPIGLKLNFIYDDNKAIAYYTITENYQGYPGMTHGGIVATILDEVMAKTILKTNIEAVTGEITIKYRKPVPIGKEIKIIGEIMLQKSRIIKTQAKIECDNVLCVESQATFIKVKL